MKPPMNSQLSSLLQLSSAYWQSCTLHAGIALDIFSHLAEHPRDAHQLAQRIQADERGLAMLLNALTAMELLEKGDEQYSVTAFSGEYLARQSPSYMGHILMHHHYLVQGWGRLGEAVRSGKPVRTPSSQGANDRERESFLLGMFNLASQLAPRIAEEIDLNGRSRLLDLAGGPGTYAIHFCLKNPDLSAVVFDLPTTRPFAEATVARFSLSQRIAFQGGDILSDSIGAGFDLVWISHLLHSEGPEANAAIIGKAARALTAGGLLLVQDFLLDNSRTAPLHPALFSLNMLIGTPAGQSYSEDEVRSLLAGAGLVAIRRLPITLPNGAGIIAAVR